MTTRPTQKQPQTKATTVTTSSSTVKTMNDGTNGKVAAAAAAVASQVAATVNTTNKSKKAKKPKKKTKPSDVLRLLKVIFLKKEFFGKFARESFPTTTTTTTSTTSTANIRSRPTTVAEDDEDDDDDDSSATASGKNDKGASWPSSSSSSSTLPDDKAHDGDPPFWQQPSLMEAFQQEKQNKHSDSDSDDSDSDSSDDEGGGDGVQSNMDLLAWYCDINRASSRSLSDLNMISVDDGANNTKTASPSGMTTNTSETTLSSPSSSSSTSQTTVDDKDNVTTAWQTMPIVQPLSDRHDGPPKTILVTGGAGFIGSSVADALLARGDRVVIVDEINDYYDTKLKNANLQVLLDKYRGDYAVDKQEKRAEDQLQQSHHPQQLIIYKGDICDEPFLTNIFTHEQPNFICHMAARAGVRPSIADPFVYIHSNIRGTTLLMDLAVKFKTVQNFVFASSSSVYGENNSNSNNQNNNNMAPSGNEKVLFREDQVVDHPVSPYAATKKACELLAYTYHHLYQLPITGLRFFTVYGPRGRPDMAPYKFIDTCYRGGTIQQYGDGSSSRDYTYIDDIVDGVVRALDRPYAYQVFNLGKGDGTSLKDFLKMVEKYVGKPAKIHVLPNQPGDVPYTCADVSKARRLLGYKPKISFEEGIQRTVAWYMDYVATADDKQAKEE